jgi:hypothetical protein
MGAYEYFPVCKGDFDKDGDVDGSDLALFAEAYGSVSGDPTIIRMPTLMGIVWWTKMTLPYLLQTSGGRIVCSPNQFRISMPEQKTKWMKYTIISNCHF